MDCFWPRCSDQKRCHKFGSCVAKAQAGGASFDAQLMMADPNSNETLLTENKNLHLLLAVATNDLALAGLEIERLRAALRPFARLEMPEYIPADAMVIVTNVGGGIIAGDTPNRISVRDVRGARAALGPQKKPPFFQCPDCGKDIADPGVMHAPECPRRPRKVRGDPSEPRCD